MRKRFYICLLSIGIILISGCNEWLYLEPEDGIIRQEYWKSKEDVHSAVMGCYASLLGNGQGKDYSVPELLFIWGEIRGDMISLHRLKSEYQYIINGDILPDNKVCMWNPFYRTINYCNTVLEFAPGVQQIDPSFSMDQLNQYMAEVRALRALMYFYLARSFGEVPIKLTATKSDVENFVIPKSSHQEILTQIKTDLRLAEAYAPITYPDLASSKGRITRAAVNAIQADVYLWNSQYDSCILACNKIINSGMYGLLENDLFWFTNLYVDGNSVESIFELQFSTEVLNPYYRMLKRDKYFRASALAIEEYFPVDFNQPPDSADIRADGASYKISDNYTIWKYIGKDRYTARFEYEAYGNFIIYRFAEILLFKAEALSQQGNINEALKLVNLVRKRGQASKASAYVDVSDPSTMTEYVLAERCREFAYEGKRWYDVLRVARRNDYERMDLLISMVLRSAPAEKRVTIMNKYLDTQSHYFPIYYTELQANPALEQNPFYGEEF